MSTASMGRYAIGAYLRLYLKNDGKIILAEKGFSIYK